MSQPEMENVQDLEEGADSSSNSDSESENENDVTVTEAVPKVGDDSDDTSSEESDDMEVEDLDEVEKQLTLVKEQLVESPHNYDLLVEKIRLVRQSGELEQLRDTREKLSSLYPLSESLWLDWIKDEMKLVEEDKTAIYELFERAVKDYLSVEVWLEYTKFALTEMHGENGVEQCREVFERALSSGGLHVSLGSLIWDAYRDFEAAVIGVCTDDESRVEQEKRYLNVCRRQLSVPLIGMDKTFEEDLKTKLLDDDMDSVKDKFDTAFKKFKTIEPFEQQLVAVEGDVNFKVQSYKDYIAFEKREKSNPARIQCLYERGLAECPLDSSLWIDYIHYVSSSLPIADIVMKVADRSTRNCSWVVETWTEYLLAAERFDADKLVGIFEKAILNFVTVDHIGTLWLKYLECLRRILRKKDYPEKDIMIFTTSCSAAERHVLNVPDAQPEPNDYVFQIAMMNIRLMALRPEGVKHSRETWADLLLRGYGTSFRNWLQFLILEQRYGDDNSYRQQLSKATAYIKDDVLGVANLWLNFERDNGDVNQLQTSQKKIAKYLEEQAAQESYNAVPPRRFNNRPQRPGLGRNKRQFQDTDNNPRHRNFQDNDPQNKNFQSGGNNPRHRNFQGNDPRKRKFQDNDFNKRKVENNETDFKKRKFEGGDQDSKNQKFQGDDNEPKNQKFQGKDQESRNQKLQGKDQGPRNQKYQGNNFQKNRFPNDQRMFKPPTRMVRRRPQASFVPRSLQIQANKPSTDTNKPHTEANVPSKDTTT